MKKQRSIFSTIMLIVGVLLMIFAGVSGLYHFSDGFKDWSKLNPFDKPNTDDNTTQVTSYLHLDEYGTFIMNDTSTIILDDAKQPRFKSGTNFSIMYEKLQNALKVDNKQDYEFVYKINDEHAPFYDYSDVYTCNNEKLYTFENNVVTYHDLPTENQGAYTYALYNKTENNVIEINESTLEYFDETGVYNAFVIAEIIKNDTSDDYKVEFVITSDKGYPLSYGAFLQFLM